MEALGNRNSKWGDGFSVFPFFIFVFAFLQGGCLTAMDPLHPNAEERQQTAAVAGWMEQTTCDVIRFFDDPAYREAVSTTVQSWFGDSWQALHEGRVERIAANAEEARQLARWARQYESMAPYGIWLDSRLDYYEAAESAIRRVEALRLSEVRARAARRVAETRRRLSLPVVPPRRGTVTVRFPARTLPARRPVHHKTAPVPVIRPEKRPAVDSAVESVTSRAYWRRQTARHPMPSRAPALVARLSPVFVSEGVPGALVWIAEVESTFNPAARSPAGAAGLFQLMPSTARSLGLSTENPDERLDPEKNARAAARYLRRLHGRFGSWKLAFAAYNAGETRVSRLLKSKPSKTYEAISHELPLETRMYVPRVVETLRLRAHFEAS